MGVLSWLVLGIVTGVGMSYFTSREKGSGYLVNGLVGIIGAVLGGFCANLVMRLPPLSFNLASFAISVLGVLI